MNYRHLYYFWLVAREGSVTRAAERLGLAVQTVSAQLAALEQELGKSLLAPQGRRLVLTEAGRLALGYADQIFLLGSQLREALEAADNGAGRLAVGLSDALPKATAFQLLEPLRQAGAPLRLVCHEASFTELLADLALHQYDLVLTDRPVPPGGHLRVRSRLLQDVPMLIVASPALAAAWPDPARLTGAPFLLPTRSSALRLQLDQWFERHKLHPQVAGEFEDTALLTTFGRAGAGLFFVPDMDATALREQFGAVAIGPAAEVRSQCYGISSERKIDHPLVARLLGLSG
ncbi:LysR family transcriptional regulator [Massilia sp. TS11]|uniref:LysR family transcriptional regulator n=1 Tax=Massilia sp. TS11 TaxID=2908003 RepID=UPI001EDB8216|nr:LysR family transcriptional regulator [Massilia sp. TS11]MCG2585348.1 LysR family transcriptional regulator [Massilia sp. TS11]